MSSTKTLIEWGVISKVESVYGTDPTPTTSDGIVAIDMPEPDMNYIHDGSRGQNPVGGQLAGVGRSGRGAKLAIDSQMLLPGAAYAAGVFGNLHLWLRCAGFAAIVDVTVSAEKWTYTPEVSTLESCTIYTYKQGQLYKLTGGYGDFTISADGPVVPTWAFEFEGIGVIPTDVAVPTLTYINGDKDPQKALNATLLTLGGYGTAVVRGFEFSLNRPLSARANDNSVGGHAGFTPGIRDPKLVVTVEADAIATYDPYTIAEVATATDITLIIGAAQYSQWKLNMDQAELVDVREAEDGPTALWELEFSAKASAVGANDDLEFVTD